MASPYLRVEDVIEAFKAFGGEADWSAVKAYITSKRDHPYAAYKDLQNYEKTMFQLVQLHCEGYDKFRGPVLFEKVRRGRFRLVSSPVAVDRIRKSPHEVHPETVPPGREYIAGTVRQVLINAFERDPNARRACLDSHGMQCAACEMTFEQRYGSIGKGFIHVHHKKPLANREVYHLDPVDDLIPVCPNCHAMLHTYDPPLSVDELKAAMQNRNG
ncbi:MAG: HNH endonuclease [Planctomycetes bacterium]|nr:HNH endonuclease [Planctomycetota bacterium]